jgi:hypothetical protein
MGLIKNVKDALNFNRLNEAIDAFKLKGDTLPDSKLKKQRGEGFEYFPFEGFGISSFNQFYRRNINKVYTNEVAKINSYRTIASMPEIADVIEDAVIECCQQDPDGEILQFQIENEDLKKNQTALKVLEDEFKELFHNRIKIHQKLESLLRTYFIDGRIYYERLIDEMDKNKGILAIKQLPTETMDFDYNYKTGRIEKFYQYLKPANQRPADIISAVNRREAIEFNPEQIGYIDYGIYGKIKNDVLGYLEKVKVPYNQLKLLETSVVIYRLIRAPERFVFKIDVGGMPKDKAMKYVEKIKTQFVKKQSYDPQTGRLLNEPNVFCLRKNTEIPLLDGRHLLLEEIIEEFKENKNIWTYSINQETKAIEPGKITHAEITRKNEKLVRVHLDSGHYLDVTYDHKFIMRDGSECRADELKENDSLMPLYRKSAPLRREDKTYEMVLNPKNNKWIFTHWLISEFNNGKKERNYHDHHEDFNRLNNNPNNIERLHISDHGKAHSINMVNMWDIDYDKMLSAVRKGNAKESSKKKKSISRKNFWKDNYDSQVEAINKGLKRSIIVNPEYNHKVSKIEYLRDVDDCGCITVEGNHNFAVSQNGISLVFVKNSILENFFIAQSSDGKGSDISTIGGGMSQGFTELNDIYYFQKKLYQALKYPMSRVNASQTGRDVETFFMRSPIGEISRDEVKWATFLERQQNRFCSEFVDLFLLHLDFKGLKKEYNLTKDDIIIRMTQPSFFRDRQEQLLLETRFANYTALADRQEMSRFYLMQRFLEWTDEEITENAEDLKIDVALGFREPILQPDKGEMGLEPPETPTGAWPSSAKPRAKPIEPEPKEDDLSNKGNGKKSPIKAVKGGKI